MLPSIRVDAPTRSVDPTPGEVEAQRPDQGDRLTGYAVSPQLRKEGRSMASKDKNTKKSMDKKPAQKTLKEKRQAKKAKK
jgi:hypothetical protein